MATALIVGLREQDGLDKDGNPCKVRRPGIPRNAHVRVESLPRRVLIFDGKATKALPLPLDPGKYAVVINRFHEKGIGDFCYEYEFLHELTENQWQHLQTAKARYAKVMNTTEGPRWRCKIGRCDFEATSEQSAVLHEYEHSGIDFLDVLDRKLSVEEAVDQSNANIGVSEEVAVAQIKKEFELDQALNLEGGESMSDRRRKIAEKMGE